MRMIEESSIERVEKLVAEVGASVSSHAEQMREVFAAMDQAANAIARLRGETAELRTTLIDCTALLEHYVEGRPHNWDGSTERQALICIRAARAAIAKTRRPS